MTAAILRRTASERGLRPVDPRRDMTGMAQLIEVAFAERLDDSGRAMVRSMRAFGRWGWLGWALGHLFLPPAAYPSGYVWTEDGRLVGNASLMRADLGSRRWVLINVAVTPAWRRRGIARELVQSCLEQARRRGAEEVLLQVDADNRGARDLYQGLGFRTTSTRTTWARRPPWLPAASVGSGARARRPEDVSLQWALAKRLCPEGLLWPRPLDRAALRMSFPWGPTSHWVWPVEGPLQAFLSAFPGYESPGIHGILIVEPEARGRAEGPLLDLALTYLSPRLGEIQVETPDDVDGAPLRSRGFIVERRLAWMAIDLSSSPSPLARSADDQLS